MIMTRDEILDAAAQIFREKGFHAASMQDIAQAVKLRKASLYYHVSSKQEILLVLLDRGLDVLIEQIENVAGQPLTPDEKIRLAICAYLETMLDNLDLSAVLLLEHRSLEPQYNALHVPRRDRFEHLWRDMIQEGLDQGIFCCTDPDLAARYILGVMNWTITWYRPDGTLTPQAISAQFAELFLKGLIARRE
jgi:TetR/AcrR family transcriptional regulator, cholesterol catabolism regulator